MDPYRKAHVDQIARSPLPDSVLVQDTHDFTLEDFEHAFHVILSHFSGDELQRRQELFIRLRSECVARTGAQQALEEAKRGTRAAEGAYRLNKWILGVTVIGTLLAGIGILVTLAGAH